MTRGTAKWGRTETTLTVAGHDIKHALHHLHCQPLLALEQLPPARRHAPEPHAQVLPAGQPRLQLLRQAHAPVQPGPASAREAGHSTGQHNATAMSQQGSSRTATRRRRRRQANEDSRAFLPVLETFLLSLVALSRTVATVALAIEQAKARSNALFRLPCCRTHTTRHPPCLHNSSRPGCQQHAARRRWVSAARSTQHADALPACWRGHAPIIISSRHATATRRAIKLAAAVPDTLVTQQQDSSEPSVDFLGVVNDMQTARGIVHTPISPDHVYGLLTNYDQCPRVFRSVATSQTLQTEAGGKQVLQVSSRRHSVLQC